MHIAKNTICLWYDRDAEAAARFYAEVFPDSAVQAVHRAPADYPSGKAGDVLTGLVTLLNCSWSYAYIAEQMVERCPSALHDENYGAWFAGYVSEEYRQTNQALIDRIDALAEVIDEKKAQRLCEIFENCCLFDLRFWDMVYTMGEN